MRGGRRRACGRRGRRSNRCSDWRLVTATSVRAHSADRRPGAGHRAKRPRAGPNKARLNAYAPIWLLPRIANLHDTATCPRQNCLHAQRRPRRAHGDNLHPCRRKSVATPAFRRSPARLNHRHVPGKHSVARTLAATPRPTKSAARWCAAIATASRRSPGTTEPTRSSATSMPIELGRRSTSSTNGGRRTPDALRPGPPRRLPTPTRRTPRRPRDPQTRFSEGSCVDPPRLRGVA